MLDYLDGGKWELVGEFTEIESGNRSDRPELERAIAACRKQEARGRTSRSSIACRFNVAFISTLILMERKVDFIACESKARFTIHILAAVVEFERDAISMTH